MPRQGQIIPENLFPSITVVINDNTEYVELVDKSGTLNMTFFFMSPKGEDGKMKSISTYKEFVSEYGAGSIADYGQGMYNALNAFGTGMIRGNCFRIAPKNAAYSNALFSALVKEITETVEGKTVKKLRVKFVKEFKENLLSRDEAEAALLALKTDTADADGNIKIPLFALVSKGRGKMGDALRLRLNHYKPWDKDNTYKNYVFEILSSENGISKMGESIGSTYFDANYNDLSIYLEDVINDVEKGSKLVKSYFNEEGFAKIYAMYVKLFEGTDLKPIPEKEFDILLGYDKQLEASNTFINIDPTGVILSAAEGNGLQGGTDGDFDKSVARDVRDKAIETAYIEAMTGVTDEYVFSKNKFPSDLTLDANYPIAVKKALCNFILKRKDGMGAVDFGIQVSKQGYKDFNTILGSASNDWMIMKDNYHFQIRDPFTKRTTKVTHTAWLSSAYPYHFTKFNGKHVPLAGSNYAVLGEFIPGTVFPVYEKDIDDVLMNEMTELRVNYAAINSKQQIVRHQQQTGQTKWSDLTEASNVFILLEIKRRCIELLELTDHRIINEEFLRIFQNMADEIFSSYNGFKLKEIKTSFGQSGFESERNILHMYVEIRNNKIAKRAILEIDINK